MTPIQKLAVLRIACEHAFTEWQGKNPCWDFDKFEKLVDSENLVYDEAYFVFATKLAELENIKPFVLANI